MAAARAHIMGIRLAYSGTPLCISIVPPISSAATVPEMATTAPTEISMPRVAITRVMPSAVNIKGAARLTISIRLPYRWPSFHSSRKNPGIMKKSTASSSANAASGRSNG